jgi:transcriptional regulator with XRE-family HTH domain
MGATAIQFGETVRQPRVVRGLTQQDIANETTVEVSYFGKVENETLNFVDYFPEKFIHRLTEVLSAGENQLCLLADEVTAGMRIPIRQRPELFIRIAMVGRGAMSELKSSFTRKSNNTAIPAA